MEQARLRLEQQGYSNVVLVEALRSPSANPPYYEGSATRGRRVVNLMVMADGSSVVLPYAPRQRVPPRSTYVCQRLDFEANISACLGVP